MRSKREFSRHVSQLSAETGISERRIQDLFGAAIVASMLPSGSFLKGGMSIRLLSGHTGTRATRDLDAATALEIDTFIEKLRETLTQGWGVVHPSKSAIKKAKRSGITLSEEIAITGELSLKDVHVPKVDPPPLEYLTREASIRLLLCGEHVLTLDLDIAKDELEAGVSEHYVDTISPEVAQIVESFGFGKLVGSVPFISAEQQLAQKIHAFTHDPSDRAYDLIDIQIFWHSIEEDRVPWDPALFTNLLHRTFEYRKKLRLKNLDITRIVESLTSAERAKAEQVYATQLSEIVGSSTVNPCFHSATVWLCEMLRLNGTSSATAEEIDFH